MSRTTQPVVTVSNEIDDGWTSSASSAIQVSPKKRQAHARSRLGFSPRALLAKLTRGYLTFAINVDEAALHVIESEVLPRAESPALKTVATTFRTLVAQRLSFLKRALRRQDEDVR